MLTGSWQAGQGLLLLPGPHLVADNAIVAAVPAVCRLVVRQPGRIVSKPLQNSTHVMEVRPWLA